MSPLSYHCSTLQNARAPPFGGAAQEFYEQRAHPGFIRRTAIGPCDP